MKSANGSPSRAWSGRPRSNFIAEAQPNRFERRWGRTRLEMPAWQLLACAALLTLVAFVSFAVTARVVWVLVFDQETYCEEFLHAHPWLSNGETDSLEWCEDTQT